MTKIIEQLEFCNELEKRLSESVILHENRRTFCDTSADGCCDGNKIKTPFAQIIVGGTYEKPYYQILYFDTADRIYHIGFGSYCLEYVFKWLSEEFEIDEAEQEADVAPVRHGRWLKNRRFKGRSWCCSECRNDDDFQRNYCPNCGAKMDLTV